MIPSFGLSPSDGGLVKALIGMGVALVLGAVAFVSYQMGGAPVEGDDASPNEKEILRLRKLVDSLVHDRDRWSVRAGRAEAKLREAAALEERTWLAIKPEIDQLCRDRNALDAEGRHDAVTLDTPNEPKNDRLAAQELLKLLVGGEERE